MLEVTYLRLILGDLRPRLDQILKGYVGEYNEPSTRERVTKEFETACARVQSEFPKDIIQGFIVICSEDNNPPELIDRHELAVTVYLKIENKFVTVECMLSPAEVSSE